MVFSEGSASSKKVSTCSLFVCLFNLLKEDTVIGSIGWHSGYQDDITFKCCVISPYNCSLEIWNLVIHFYICK